MSGVFINYTNHPWQDWSAEQIAAAERYGPIDDMPFPRIAANAAESDIAQLVDQAAGEIVRLCPAAVLCQGEFSFTYQLVSRLQGLGILVLSACSDRVVCEHRDEDGVTHRISEFRFVQFRAYQKG